MPDPQIAQQDYDLMVRSMKVLTDELNQALGDREVLALAVRDIASLVDKPFKTDTDVSVAYICGLSAIQNSMGA